MAYVHGYSERETQRLEEQSLILEELLHGGTAYEPGSRVLEVGCGVGAQSLLLLKRNPGIGLCCLDISNSSLERARANIETAGFGGVEFLQGDIMDHGPEAASFDHVFVCFVLEHLDDPVTALRNMRGLLREGGSITVIEGDHGSGIWTPESEASRKAWDGLVESQRMQGHDPDIGRRLYPLMVSAGLKDVRVEPRPVYADRSGPRLLDEVVNQIITPMVQSAERFVLESGLTDEKIWKRGLKNLSDVAFDEGGTFYYTWFKGTGIL